MPRTNKRRGPAGAASGNEKDENTQPGDEAGEDGKMTPEEHKEAFASSSSSSSLARASSAEEGAGERRAGRMTLRSLKPKATAASENQEQKKPVPAAASKPQRKVRRNRRGHKAGEFAKAAPTPDRQVSQPPVAVAAAVAPAQPGAALPAEHAYLAQLRAEHDLEQQLVLQRLQEVRLRQSLAATLPQQSLTDAAMLSAIHAQVRAEAAMQLQQVQAIRQHAQLTAPVPFLQLHHQPQYQYVATGAALTSAGVRLIAQPMLTVRPQLTVALQPSSLLTGGSLHLLTHPGLAASSAAATAASLTGLAGTAGLTSGAAGLAGLGLTGLSGTTALSAAIARASAAATAASAAAAAAQAVEPVAHATAITDANGDAL